MADLIDELQAQRESASGRGLVLMTSAQTDAVPTSIYESERPSAPALSLPFWGGVPHELLPPYVGLGCDSSTNSLMSMIAEHAATEIYPFVDWKYEKRRQAQPLLSYLYLGPMSAAKDVEFLKREGITMLLAIRDTSIATAKFMSGEKTARILNIISNTIDISGPQQLIAAFPIVNKTINSHLISIHETQLDSASSMNQSGSGEEGRLPGKVLVFCESGNERSAAVVAAYIMAMFDLDLVSVVPYLQARRLCCAINDSLQQLLFTYRDILKATRAVQVPFDSNSNPQSSRGAKRVRNDISDVDVNMKDITQDSPDPDYDGERFSGREAWAPFRDGLPGL